MSVLGKAIASIFLGFVFTIIITAFIGGIGQKFFPNQKTTEEKLLEKYPDKNSEDYRKAKYDADGNGLLTALAIFFLSPFIVFYLISKFETKKTK